MANNRLSSAYRARGKASSRYKASLYDVENLGFEREASKAMYDFETQQRDTTIALIQEGIGLASDVYGGFKSKAEAKADRASLQEGMAKKAYGASEAEKIKAAKSKGEVYKSVDWEKLEDKSSYMSEFAPKEVERSFLGKLFGEEKKYTFGAGEGKDEFTSAQITAASTLYGENKLSDLLGITTPSTAVKDLKPTETGDVLPKLEATETKTDVTTEDYSKEIFDLQPGSDFTPSKKAEGSGDVDLSKIGEFEIPSLLGDDDLPGHYAREPKGKSIKSFAKGGKFTTDGPETILVGDNPGGKEKVTVKPIKSKKKEKSEGQNNLADNVGSNLKDLVSRKGMRPGSKNWLNNYIRSQKVNNESLRPLSGELSKYNKKLFSMAEEAGYFGEFFRGGWE